MKHFIFSIALSTILLSLPAYAADYQATGGFGCINKDYFNKIVTIAVQEGGEGFKRALLLGIAAGNCTLFEKGEPVYLMKAGLMTIKIRREGEMTEYWTTSETIK